MRRAGEMPMPARASAMSPRAALRRDCRANARSAAALHQRVRGLDAASVVRGGRGRCARRLTAAGKCWCSATAAAPPTRSTWRPSWSAGSSESAPGSRRWRLTTDTSLLTSVANDYGFERVFARQIEALGTAGDVAFAITTSGTSPNVVRGLEAARGRGMRTVALTGRDGGEAGRLAEIHINVPDDRTARVQEVHIDVDSRDVRDRGARRTGE